MRSQDDIYMRKDTHQKKGRLDLRRAGEKHIPILPPVSRSNPKLTCIYPQVHCVLIPVLTKKIIEKAWMGSRT